MNHPRHHAAITPDKIAYQMVDCGNSLTFAELEASANQAAHTLRTLNVKPGEHIAFLLENRLELMVLIWAALRSGIIFTPISRYLQHGEISYIVKDCDARLFITSQKYAQTAERVRNDCGENIGYYMIDQALGGYKRWETIAETMPKAPISDETAGSSMLYSSGTTGRPKGVKRAYPNAPLDSLSPVLLKVCQDLAGMTDKSIYLSPAPLYHSAPMAAAMVAAGLGATSYIMTRFDETLLLELIEKHAVTHLQAVPTMFVRLTKLPDEIKSNYDVSSLVAALHVAAPCPVQIKKQMIDWWGPVLIEYYAGTEGNGVTAVNSEDWLKHEGTVGRALYGSVHILDDDGRELPSGKIGNVYFNTGFKFSYHKDETKTQSAFTPQGWSTLGDIGWLNEDGYLFLTDRKSYTIISGGVNIYPQETEDFLVTHPDVADVAVFGVPNEELGEEVKAVVCLNDYSLASPDLETRLIDFCRSHLSAIKTPKSIDFQKKLPRTPTGKLIKRHLKAKYWPQ